MKNILTIVLALFLIPIPVKGQDTPQQFLKPLPYGDESWRGTYDIWVRYAPYTCSTNGYNSQICKEVLEEYLDWMMFTETSIDTREKWKEYLTLVCDFKREFVNAADCNRATGRYLTWIKRNQL